MRRATYIPLALGTIAIGLAVHWGGDALDPALRDFLGDIIWATMIAWWIGALVPGSSVRVRSAWALALCFTVELSQLYHAPALDSLRSTPAGHLVLGSGFNPHDLFAYTLGVLAAILIERFALRGR